MKAPTVGWIFPGRVDSRTTASRRLSGRAYFTEQNAHLVALRERDRPRGLREADFGLLDEAEVVL
jgi:hypothetical protein